MYTSPSSVSHTLIIHLADAPPRSMSCGCSPCGNVCVCDLIRREIRVVGVVRSIVAPHHHHLHLCCTTIHWTLFVLLLLWNDAPGAALPSHITLLVVHHSSHQATVVVSTAVREWSSPSATVRGSADNWSGMEVHVDANDSRLGIGWYYRLGDFYNSLSCTIRSKREPTFGCESDVGAHHHISYSSHD